MSKLALKLIKEAEKTRATRLDLGNCNLTELPDELKNLHWLEELILSNKWREPTLEGYSIHNSKNDGQKNQLARLSPVISELVHLKSLCIGNWYERGLIEDISPIKDLTNLEILYCTCTKISFIETIRGLTNLKSIDFSLSELEALDGLSNLTQLVRVNLSHCNIKSIKEIENLENIEYLIISNTKVKDLSPIKNSIKLKHLNIANTNVLNLLSLEKLENLESLTCSSTNIESLQGIENLFSLKTLYCSKTNITAIPDLSPFPNLMYIDFSKNSIRDIAPLHTNDQIRRLNIGETLIQKLDGIQKNQNLEELSIHKTPIKSLSPLSGLKNLQVLEIGGSNVQNISPLKKLHSLKRLGLCQTLIKDITPLKHLKNLEYLNVSTGSPGFFIYPNGWMTSSSGKDRYKSQIRDFSSLSHLKNLKQLILNNTKIEDLSILKDIIQRGIPVILENISSHQILENKPFDSSYILVRNCPLSNPPIEIAQGGNEAILRYWEQVEKQEGTVELYEAKLIIVGEGSTGKTTLFEKLKDPTFQVGNTPETHGINIHEGLPFQHLNIGENTFHVNLWDFGGQDLQYMTHQFFLTPRALYVLMMDARRESPNLAYWFKIISLLGRESEDTKEKVKVLLVFNKRSNTTGLPQYQDILKFYEDSIDAHFIEVDFSTNDYRFENLQKSIQEHLVRLPIVKSQLPRLWKDVREDLRAEAKKENYISTKRFAEICTNYNIDIEEDQWLLSGYLHQLGSLLHFQNNKGLRTWVILNPQWAVNGVYSFLMDEEIRNNFGHFSESDFIQSLAKKGYLRDEADLILQLMTKNNFDICYEASPGSYVAAQLLPDLAPEYHWFPKNALQFRYQYSIMPKGLMSRLIIRLSEFLDLHPETKKQIVWKKGGIFRIKLREGECRIRLREDDAESQSGLRQILIEVIGDSNARKYALHKVRDAVEYLHRTWFRSLTTDEMVPCCCSKCTVSDEPELYKLEKLLKAQKNRPDKSCDESGENVAILALLEGIYDSQEINDMTR